MRGALYKLYESVDPGEVIQTLTSLVAHQDAVTCWMYTTNGQGIRLRLFDLSLCDVPAGLQVKLVQSMMLYKGEMPLDYRDDNGVAVSFAKYATAQTARTTIYLNEHNVNKVMTKEFWDE